MTEPVTYPREAVLTPEQLAAALSISLRAVDRLDLPVVYLGGKGTRLPRYVWGMILDVLAERAA